MSRVRVQVPVVGIDIAFKDMIRYDINEMFHQPCHLPCHSYWHDIVLPQGLLLYMVDDVVIFIGSFIVLS